jgi:hypothetical protein
MDLKRSKTLRSAPLKKEIEVLTAQLHEQASQIQKVSAQLELRKPAPKTVARSQ